MPNTFRNEEYADMHFANSFCNESGRVLLWNTDRYPHRKTFETVHRILRVTGSFPRENADREQQRRA